MKKTLLVMSKSPVLGYAKTRMQPHLSESQSLELHITLAQSCLKKWTKVEGFSIALWIGGDVDVFRTKVLLSMENGVYECVDLHSQPEGDLGERMLFAVDSTVNGIGKDDEGVFLVGTDCPLIDKQYLELAASALEKNDIVLGPAMDGGYVLLGMKKSYSALFTSISWGTSSVLAQTQSIIQREGLQSVLLSPLPDIDVIADLKYLEHLCEYKAFFD